MFWPFTDDTFHRGRISLSLSLSLSLCHTHTHILLDGPTHPNMSDDVTTPTNKSRYSSQPVNGVTGVTGVNGISSVRTGDSGESTPEESDILPNETSATTDTVAELSGPVDFIERRPHSHTFSTSALSQANHGRLSLQVNVSMYM